MGHFRFAALAASAAIFACCVCHAHAREAHVQIAQQQLDQRLYEQKLQDTRQNIKKETTTTRPTGNGSDQLAVDICKKNPQLPQCKFK